MDWQADAKHFLEHETQFHLGMLPTEQPHPSTKGLAELLQRDVAAGVRMLLEVDQDVAESADRVFAGDEFAQLVEALGDTLRAGGRICFSGCGATGRLSIMLEACWRHFWQGADRGDQVCSIMTGGDYALVKSVENFEDYASFGRQQVKEAGLGEGDVLVAISEGGETSSVIGTIWEAHERGARTFFVFSNPAEILAEHIERSREVIESPAVVILDVSSGPMGITGSTRMQATTAELLIVGAALELALAEVCPDAAQGLTSADYARDFGELLADLAAPAAVAAMAEWVGFERELYEAKGLVTYFADHCLLDIFTDTTERSPTFMLPPFRKSDDTVSAPPWAFVKSPLLSTAEAWRRVLGRETRCLAWDRALYAELGAPAHVQQSPPLLDAGEIQKFPIGKEDDPSRYASPASSAVLAVLAAEVTGGEDASELLTAFATSASPFAARAAVVIGEHAPPAGSIEPVFHIPCRIPATPLRLFDRLAVKLPFNTVSTATMGCMGRVVSNWMAHVDTTNKKLIDRGTRLITELAGVDYETACYALHETNEELRKQTWDGRERPSPVMITIERLRGE